MTRIGAVVLVLAAGCRTFGGAGPAGHPVTRVHAGAQELRVLDIASPLRARRKIPILRTPEVLAAYVPAHVERDLMIGDHWVYIKLKEAEFFVEEIQDPDLPLDGDAPANLIKPLDSVEWSRGVVPHREK